MIIMSKTQRWEWAIGLQLEELNDHHLQLAYKLNWDNLCKFDSCRKNCKRILCLACFDRSWIETDSANSSGYDHYDTSNCELKRADLKSFVGLKNLGATCYVNCLLQLWFHNPALRKAIYEWDKNGSAIDGRRHDEVVITSQKMILDSVAVTSGKNHEQSLRASNKRPRDEENKLQLAPSKKLNKISTENNDRRSSLTPEFKILKSGSTPVITSPAKTTTTITTVATTSLSPAKSQQSRAKDPVQTNAIEQLQLIFARLQFTNKKSIDPFNFIDSLALNAAEQQDAQEFGNLFMEFLEKSFANQRNSFVSKIIQNQFCGRYSYATICDHCKHNSLSDSNFYELDLSIQKLETLHDCLNEFFRPVPLDGKYNCSRCEKAQSAHREIILKSLPPTLNLQLLRFVYDVQRNVRQKLNSYIIFPEILDMSQYLEDADLKSKSLDLSIRNNNDTNYLTSNGTSLRSSTGRSSIYVLSAVLIHRGSSPHSGHYIAHIKDRITKDWYKFNDDSVERIGPQLQVSTDGENISIVEDKTETIKIADPSTGKVTRIESKSLKSKTAYMLVYQAQDNEALTYPSDHSEKWILPEHLQTSVAEENSRSDEFFESLQIAKEVDQQIMDVRKSQIRTIYEKLLCRNPSEKFEFISKSWLQCWLTNSSPTAKFQPIDNTHLLCIHNKLNFRKLDQVKCVRSEGVDLLYKEFGGGPRLQDAMCRDCVELEVKLIQLKDRLKTDQKYITSQAKFKIESDYDFADAYIVGKNSYRDWQSLVMVQFKKSYPELKGRDRGNGNNQHVSSDEDDSKNDKVAKESKLENREAPKTTNDDNHSNSESDDEAIEKFVFNSDILCEHNQLINDPTAWRIVPKEVWKIFKHYFGDDPTRPLIEHNANTLMCAECKRQEVEQQEIGDIQKQKASQQKTRLPDLFHTRKRASWCSMLPGDVYYALDRQFLTKWQKFVRNPCHQEQPTEVRNRERLVCEHGKLLYNYSNSNPVLSECPFILISKDELVNLKQYYPIDCEIMFSIEAESAAEKLKAYVANLKTSQNKKLPIPTVITPQTIDGPVIVKQIDSGDINETCTIQDQLAISNSQNSKDSFAPINDEHKQVLAPSQGSNVITECKSTLSVDLSEIDWSECVRSDPGFCSDCHEMLKRDELKKLLNYDTATIYITKVENPCVYGPQNNPNPTNNGGSFVSSSTDNCDNEINQISTTSSKLSNAENLQAETVNNTIAVGLADNDDEVDEITSATEENLTLKRKKKFEDGANEFVPPSAAKQPTALNQSSSSILRRTTRRNRNREQAYTIKPSQTLLELKKEIFSRCQVLPVDQRLFLNDNLLDDNRKTMSELRIVPNCSLKLEVDRPMSDNIDLIEDESASRKSCAQPETGFKGSLLLSNSHF